MLVSLIQREGDFKMFMFRPCLITTCLLFTEHFVKSRGLFVKSTCVRKSYCTLNPWCRNNCMESVSRMYTMMEEYVHTRSTNSLARLLTHLLTSTLTYVELHLGRRLGELAVEGEEGEDGDQVGGELVLIQPLLNWVEEWGRQNLEQSLKQA